MDPLTIVSSSLALAKLCSLVGWELKKFIDGTKLVGTAINALSHDVQSFEKILEQMKDTVNDPKVKASLVQSGHVGSHWSDLQTSLDDAEETLKALEATILRVNKSTNVLDSTRKQIRLKGATDEIAVYQQMIRSYKDTIQVSLQTTMFWHQVSAKESSEKVVPAMDQLQITIRELAIDINSRLEAMEDKMRVNPSDEETLREGATEFRTLGNLRSCLKSAASVVSSASTIYGYEKVGDGANAHDSDFGDVFPRETSSIMLSWIESNEITEAGEASNSQNIATGLEELRHSAPISAPGEWDSDEEEELEITQALFQQGLSNLKADEISEAEKHLRNCIDRLSNNQWPQSLANQLKPLRFDAMSALVTVLQKQQNWDDAEKLLKEKIILAASLHMHRNYLTVLDDTLMLSEVLLEKKDFTEALLYGRRVYRAFKKQSPQNRDRCASAILVIIRIYELSGNQSDAEAYIALFRQNFSQSTDETEHSLSREGVHMQYVQQQTRECGLQEQHPQSPQLGLSASEEPVETQKLQEAKEGQSTTSDSLRFDLKLVLLGGATVGKSCLVSRFTKGSYYDKESTIGAASYSHSIKLDEMKTIKFEIWDTAGRDRFRSLWPVYYRDADCAMVVYDITQSSSLDTAKICVKELQRHVNRITIALVGNKLDLVKENPSKRAISRYDVQQYADNDGLLFFEASAKTAENVHELWTKIGNTALVSSGYKSSQPLIHGR